MVAGAGAVGAGVGPIGAGPGITFGLPIQQIVLGPQDPATLFPGTFSQQPFGLNVLLPLLQSFFGINRDAAAAASTGLNDALFAAGSKAFPVVRTNRNDPLAVAPGIFGANFIVPTSIIV